MTVRVLVVDDSPTSRLALRIALEGEADIEVVGEAHDEATTFEALEHLAPDLVTMDVYLGRDNGLRVAARIMREVARPILVVTAASPGDPNIVYRALEAGALDVFPKLPSPTHPSYEQRRRRFVRLVRTLSEVPVVHRRRREGPAPEALHAQSQPEVAATVEALAPRDERSAGSRILVVGASTGGPPVLARLLASLEAPFPHPIAIVQHIMPGFMAGLAGWLSETTGHRTRIVDARTFLEPGVIHLPPDDRHLVLASNASIEPSDEPARHHQRPSIDILFEGAARHFGARAVGLILTGMGNDGSVGLAALHRAGAITIAQALETCAVDSMPRSAIALGAVRRICAPAQLPDLIRVELQSSPSKADTR